ncbi:MAG: insulinase family protein [Deltaproteobacteria bacterium]|nr:insulinase family protein [Deltaproteobacteria bacterium]
MSLKIKIVFFLFCFLISFSGFADPELIQPQFPPVKEMRLKNGMKFLLVYRKGPPIFSAYIRFRVGGADEEKGKTGLAHFLEHMAFKGIQGMNEADLSRLIEKKGGKGFNASTSKDITSYMVSFPTDQLEFWATIESERIFRPNFSDFDKEREVILEERRMRVEDDPDGRLYEELLLRAFKDTPYEWPTIGLAEDLRKVTQEDLKEFWGRHYHPDQAVGVLVGNFDLVAAGKILTKTFGKIPAGLRRGEKEFEKNAFVSENFKMTDEVRPRIAIVYLKPPPPNREDYVFDLIDGILGKGRSSRLYRKLVIEKKVAAGVEVYSGAPGIRGPNLFFVRLTPFEGHSVEEVTKAYEEEIEKFRREGPTAEEVQKAINNLLIELLWSLKTNEGLAEQLSYFETALGSWRYLETYLGKITEISREEIQEVAERYLDPSQKLTGVLAP